MLNVFSYLDLDLDDDDDTDIVKISMYCPSPTFIWWVGATLLAEGQATLRWKQIVFFL